MLAKKAYKSKVAHLESEALKMYGAMVVSMDEAVGAVLDTLDRLGLADNTLLAFASDNGPTYAYNVEWPEEWPKELLGSAGNLRSYKGQIWDGGLKVPYILRWLAKLKAGLVYTESVSTLDLYPIFCAVADPPIPGGTHLDGVNLVPYLKENRRAGLTRYYIGTGMKAEPCVRASGNCLFGGTCTGATGCNRATLQPEKRSGRNHQFLV